MTDFANIEEALREAEQHQLAGRLKLADQIASQILAIHPQCGAAWYLRGKVAQQFGQMEVSAQFIDRAIALGLQSPEAFNSLGDCLQELGRIEESIARYRAATQLDPNHLGAMQSYGAALNAAGRWLEALPVHERVIALKPDLASAHYDFGVAYASLGRLDDAVREWQITVGLQPNHAMAKCDLGGVLHKLKRHSDAVAVLEELIISQPDFVPGYLALGEVLSAIGKHDAAIAVLKKASEQFPNCVEIYDTLGVICGNANRYDESIEALRQALSIAPDRARVITNIAITYWRMENYTEAAKFFERAVELNPRDIPTSQAFFNCLIVLQNYAHALKVVDRAISYYPQRPNLHWVRANALLALGDYVEGFKEYEWRIQCKGFESLNRGYNSPRWDGESDIRGKTILVHAEQGYGDIIQFARYIPLLVKQGAKVIVCVPWDVCPIIESISGIVKVVYLLDRAVVPHYDYHVPLLSLARVFETTLETIPGVPYVYAEKARIEKWKSRIDSHGHGFRVGLVWGGSASPEPRRTCPLSALSALADVPGVCWYSLQSDEHRKELVEVPNEMKILDLGRDFMDFGDTAAVMSQLDLVITIDTSTAHLSGALGVKTWAMIIYGPDWRWVQGGDISPWYPTMRLFRQPALYDWNSVIARIRSELLVLVAQSS